MRRSLSNVSFSPGMLLLAERIKKLDIGWNERPLVEADMHEICRGFGVRVEEMPLRLDGFYFRAGGRDAIAVNSRLTPQRKLLVLFHELGHFLLHAPCSGPAAGFHHVGGRTRDEIEADIFAACAVLPRSLIEGRTEADLLAADGYLPELVTLRFQVLRDHGF